MVDKVQTIQRELSRMIAEARRLGRSPRYIGGLIEARSVVRAHIPARQRELDLPFVRQG